ncbi:MAG: efflux RND transporter periplasmic adaptor subunit [Paraglaciecola sp.]|uniref:efflux RND transporter periplasmic adaptor subunit n=1 Tax=Paraglaciecola sp. TaxID=1920173 RepID=UPI00273E1F29|nr:efflux RND transporter periplasmic adaptor subunit [Paraglaciecola sp.]MDP5029069.1 efflux RND transporter periplasmic adaptor subunit [Paraglaciecola sp.]MDP5129610.1 efflux RND transporter periplasmic adaptor subunit [Paraglaciecola sp.]
MKLSRFFTTLVLLGGSALFLSACSSEKNGAESQQRPPQAVDVVTLVAQDVLYTQSLPARSIASKKSQIRPQVSGIIMQRLFDEGSVVEAGQPLYQIDPTVYEANLLSAEAEIAENKANLQEAKADLSRYNKLIKQKLVSQQDLDIAQAQFDGLEAKVGVLEAALHKAKLNIKYTKVLAPIGGRISKSSVTEGALVVEQQAAALAEITQLDPIYFDLPMANDDLRRIKQRIATGELQSVDPVAVLTFSDGEKYVYDGEVKFNEVQTDPSTDTVSIRVEFSNPEYILLPGMFGKVTVHQAKRINSLLIPQKSLLFSQDNKPYVYVVDNNNTVQQRFVTIDRAFDASWLILSGLTAGERVIVAGLQKVAIGMTVAPNDITQQQKAA